MQTWDKQREAIDAIDDIVADASELTRKAALADELVAALKAHQSFAMREQNPFNHKCQWCVECVRKVGLMREAALAKYEAQKDGR